MPHILITDDDPHLRRLVRTYAELEGFECTEAGDGAGCEDIISGSVPHGSGAFPYEPDATADRGTENAAGDV